MKSIDRIPRHIGIIMDGNRRWAKEHGMRLFKGHEVGVDRLESTVSRASKQGIEFLTFWAFSTENWKRSKMEVEFLMQVFRNVLAGPMPQRLMNNGVKINVIGDLTRFPKDIQEKVARVIHESSSNTTITVNLALNYGGREEILRAVNSILKDYSSSESASWRANREVLDAVYPELKRRARTIKIDEKTFASYLATAGQPDPDLIIRTGGEQRLSGFLPWQAVYSELYFTPTYWPDFDEKEFDKALEDYAARERRFGK